MRAGLVSYNEIKKAELWQIVQALLDNPALGLHDHEDQQLYNKELHRILSIYFDLDNMTRENAIHAIGRELSYETLLALYQFLHYHVMALADAKAIVEAKPGEFEHVANVMQDRTKSSSFEPKKEKVDISFALAAEMMQFTVELAQSASDLLSLVDDKSLD
jgi:hypothetical protein